MKTLLRRGMIIFNNSGKISKTIPIKEKGGMFLKRYTIAMDPSAAKFYETIAEKTGTTAERLMSATLFRFAGEIAAKTAKENQNPKS